MVNHGLAVCTLVSIVLKSPLLELLVVLNHVLKFIVSKLKGIFLPLPRLVCNLYQLIDVVSSILPTAHLDEQVVGFVALRSDRHLTHHVSNDGLPAG